MFLKRSLFLLTLVLLFIGAFLLRARLADADLEKVFRQEREKYGVQGLVLTAAQPSFTMPAPAVSAPPSAGSTPLSTTPDSSATPAPGAAPDTNVIIGPVPPTAAGSETTPSPSPDTTPAPAPSPDSAPMPSNPAPPAPSGPLSPVPNVDTNNGPIAPASPPSTYVSPRAAHWLSLVLGVTVSTQAGATNESAPVNPVPVNPTPTVSASTNATAKSAVPVPVSAPTNPASATNAVTPPTPVNSSAPVPATVPAHAVSAAGRVIVLGYHQFTAAGVHSANPYSMSQDVFAGEMKYLQDNGYNVVPLSDVVRFVKGERGLPPNAVAITIDDGYKSALNYAAPVLKQYGYPWTYFVYPAFITRTEGKGAASWPDLVALTAEGVDVESHSMTHPQLSRHRQMFVETPSPNGGKPTITYGRTYHELSPQEYDDFLTNETAGSKAILEKELGKKIRYFAYPYGDYNQAVQAKTIAAGYEAIFTVADNPVHITTDVYSIGRYIITKPVERLFASYLKQGALSLAQVDPAPGATTSNPQPVITAVLGFTGDPKTLETSVRDFGVVRHDFDPATSTVRIYLPRPLVQPEVLVSIRARDVQSGQIMVANWHFNFEPAGGTPAPAHPPIGATTPASEPATNVSATSPVSTTTTPATNGSTAGRASALPPPATNGPALSAKSTK
jgi:peptidoglycan/xylan/chitin deacetylase (PgdA/CDA1 family)